jgi:S-methylmethionine-dependent homocysteine/selenocysteine methylase
MLAARLSVFDR